MLLGFSNQQIVNGPPLPLDLTFVGAPGCTLYVSMELAFPLTGVGGVADFHLPIPPLLALSGLRYYQQALVYDADQRAASTCSATRRS